MRRLITVTVLVAALTAVSPAAAITYGTPDGQRHPNVGGLVAATQYPDGTWLYCSGTLISPTVVPHRRALRGGRRASRSHLRHRL